MPRWRELMMAWLGAKVLLAALGLGAAAGQDAARTEMRSRLSAVETWGAQYQGIDVARLAASSLDLVVIDPDLDGHGADTRVVKTLARRPDGSRRLVIAYLSVGAGESWRGYWRPSFAASPPDWLGRTDPAWPGSYTVRYWHPQWHDIVFAQLDRILAAGFDGVFLDRVDGYGDWRDRPNAQRDMTDLVHELAVRARTTKAGFAVIAQNAEHLLADPRYRGAIDAVSKESLFTGLAGEGTENRPEDTGWSLSFLQPAQRDGLVIFAIEYGRKHPTVAAAALRLRKLGFKPFVADRLLDRVPD
jgi:cysteinyl-tRNA synthetase